MTRLTKELGLSFYRLGFMAKQMDERAQKYIRRSMGWSYHARCSGHEGIQVALGMHFRQKKDFLFPYYRDLALALSAGISPYEIFLNGLSKDADVAGGGRHMSNHFAKPEIGIQNVSSCTGNHTLHAVGLARAIKYYESDALVFCSQGDASTSEGYCFEAFNGAAREGLRVIFVIQNNGYGISTPTSEQSKNLNVAQNYAGISGLKILNCNGLDFIECDQVVKEAILHTQKHNQPVIIHAQCVRIGAHSNSDAHELYRSKEEIDQVKVKDPILALREKLVLEKLATEKQLDELEATWIKELDEAAEQAEAQAVPAKESVYEYAMAPAYEPKNTHPAPQKEDEKLREAINRTLVEEFTHNPHTFLWGQDVASKDKGGVFNVTKGLLAQFGNKRVFNAPLAEDFIVGTANGMCRFDPNIRVVIEAAQFADYIWPAMEQIVEMGHEYWRTKGQFCPNVVLRVASGGYITGGLYHSQNIEAIMGHLPGTRVVYPAYADDAAGLLRTAIRSQGMTFFLEPKYLYNRAEAKGPQYDKEYAIPFGQSKVRHEGNQLSLITYGNTTHLCLQAAQALFKEGYSVEVLDLRCLKPLDESGILNTVKKTGRVVIVHEDHQFNGLSGEISALVAKHAFEYLDAPIERVCALDIPVGFAKNLEIATLPNQAQIEKACLDTLLY